MTNETRHNFLDEYARLRGLGCGALKSFRSAREIALYWATHRPRSMRWAGDE